MKKSSKKRKRSSSSSSPKKVPPEIVAQLSEIWEKKIKKKNKKNKNVLPTSALVIIMTEDLELDLDEREISGFVDKETADKDTFIRFAGPRLFQRQQAMRAFDLFDEHGKGVVIREDVERVAASLGESLDETEVDEMVNLIDTSGEGLLDPSAFVRLAKSVGL
ncbi:Calcium binding protein [Seminavis robusta]|uniref:Calcium binding protein n=1 Tax=Seminavis robusta TaxID=568900 RepID=A0A9N8EZG9_9STRA|nr:Calcium binding protein [Seminavis robusta]|eukprot:Sro2255_g320990.1 Calcium binding protein (163) ;mRNA; f:11348-11956